MQPSVGRKQINHEQVPARLREGTRAAIKTVLRDKEKIADFLREAVEEALVRRGAKWPPDDPADKPPPGAQS